MLVVITTENMPQKEVVCIEMTEECTVWCKLFVVCLQIVWSLQHGDSAAWLHQPARCSRNCHEPDELERLSCKLQALWVMDYESQLKFIHWLK